MRYLALVLGLLGLFILYGFFLREPFALTSSVSLPLHSYVSFSGFVDSETVISNDFRILSINNFTVTCSCRSSYLHRIVSVRGLTELYNGELQIKAITLDILP